MIEGDSRQQLELGVSAGLAQRVRETRELMMKAPTRPHDELKDMQWVALHPAFKETLAQLLIGYENMLRERELRVEPNTVTTLLGAIPE